ncbi:hypothetical protein [Metasolibacillus sp.]|uniref:hypothetical protein n=1 Tax=Metasolibacillus sp. TaxID=2703680 RepID=UPI0025F113CB|nr:hypothetical protein [Metasolibacillus sp.]MCT6925912.1 hypothetical protein [Metasolibacillus sp.]MCT6942167.1 hypothetical protein [Metasolibacillus sp.]
MKKKIKIKTIIGWIFWSLVMGFCYYLLWIRRDLDMDQSLWFQIISVICWSLVASMAFQQKRYLWAFIPAGLAGLHLSNILLVYVIR